jgi:hypothetical protein
LLTGTSITAGRTFMPIQSLKVSVTRAMPLPASAGA